MKNYLLTFSLLLGGVAVAHTPTMVAQANTPKASETKTQAKSANTDAVVARIAGQEIALAEYENAFRIAVARMVNNQGVPFKAKMLVDFDELRPSFLKQLVRDRIIATLASKNHQPNKEEVDEQYKKARERFKKEEDFVKALGTIGFTSGQEYRTELERRSTEKAYQKDLFEKFKFNDQAIALYYNNKKKQFEIKPEACVKHILVKEQKEAEEIAKQLKDGEDFAKIAKEKSKDPGSGKQGGDLGCISPGDTVPSFDKASFSGPLNKVQMVQSKYGWHLVVVSKRNKAGYKPLEKAKDEIRQVLGREAAQKYLDAQVKKVKVETFPEVVTKVKKTKKNEDKPNPTPKASEKGDSEKQENTEQKDKKDK